MVETNTDEAPQPVKTKTRLQRFKEKTKGALKFSFLFFSAIHISEIVIAAIYYNDCPVEPDIPKYLLALGILGVLTKMVTLFRDFLIKHIQISLLLSFLTTAELTVLIVASYYVYREYPPSYDSSDYNYCNKTVYLFSFIYITILYSVLFVIGIAIGCFIFGLILMDKVVTKDVEDVGEASSKPDKN